MSKCKYPKKVIKNNIEIYEDKESKCCYKILIPICSNGKNILVICRKSKIANEEMCSRLSSRVTKYVLSKFDDVSSITCVCLISSYDLETVKENESLEKVNMTYIKEEIEKASIIIAAWGEPYKAFEGQVNDKIADIYEYIRESMLNTNEKKQVLRVGELTKRGYPKHYLVWKSNDKFETLLD
ncbi:MAG: DUF1643 domain-containing protein [Clostridium sp.]